MRAVERDLDEREQLTRRSVVVHFWWWLGSITALGLGLRLLVIALSRQEKVTGDGYEWSAQGNLNAAGHWFVSPFSLKPDALRPPCWTLVLTVWAWLGQHSWFHQQILGCLIGTVTVMLVGLCTRRLAGDRAGLIAAGIAAVYAGLWMYERALLSETLLLPEIALFILLVYRFRDRPSIGGAALLGGMCGVLALTRAEQILIFPLVVLPVMIGVNRTNLRRAVTWLALAAVVALAVIMPWTIFNLGRFQHPVLLSNAFGPAVAQANCNPAYYGPEIGYGDVACLYPFYQGDQSVTDGKYLHQAVTYAEGHLTRVPLVVFAREGRTFGFWNPFQQADIDAQWMGTWVGVTRLALISYWCLLVPAVLGAVTLRRRRVPLYPILGFVITIIVAVAPSTGDPRYRAAAEVPLVLLAAVGVDALLSRKRAVPSVREPANQPQEVKPRASSVSVSDG